MPNERIVALIEDSKTEVEELLQKVDDYDSAVAWYRETERPNVYVLGKLMQERNLAERQLRHCSAAFLNIYGYNKYAFRDFFVGYSVNDDGIAIDADGKPLPSSKVSKDGIPIKHDEDVDKCDACDTFKIWIGEDKYCEVSRKDSALIKEILANYDIPTLDGIVRLYAITKDKIAGGEYAEVIDKSINHELRHASKKHGYKRLETSELFSTDVSLGKFTDGSKNKK